MVSLIDFLGENIVNYNIPIIIFSDNYRCIDNNYYWWFKMRKHTDDLSIDIHGNINYIKDII